jgi:hypothetical protein
VTVTALPPALPLDDPVYDTKGAANYIGVSPKTLERYRLTGIPPIEYIKLHDGPRAPVRYRKSVLDALLAAGTRCSTSERKP